MTTLKEIDVQIEQHRIAMENLQKQRDEVRVSERADAIAQVNALIQQHGLKAEDLVLPKKPKRAPRKIKYRDPANTENVWDGCGRTPKWMGDRPKEEFLISNSADSVIHTAGGQS